MKRRISALVPPALFIFIFSIYLTTIAPTIVQIDSGELAAVQYLPGIAHPTGYPLFTLAGYVFTRVLYPLRPVFASNLLAALFCSLGAVTFYFSSLLILRNPDVFSARKIKPSDRKKKKPDTEPSPKISPDAAALYSTAVTAALMLAFSKTYWTQSTSVEVYSLHLFLVNIIIFLLLKFCVSARENLYRSFILLTAALAVGFTNHMTTVLILPGAAYLMFSRFHGETGHNPILFFREKRHMKKLGIAAAVFFGILLTFYCYLPLRAVQSPAVSWGNTVNLREILNHISGKQYQVWFFSSADAAKKQLTGFIDNLPEEFAVVSLLFSIAGIILSLIMARRLFVFLTITFLTTVFYSVNYDISDIEPYFLLAYIALCFFALFGIARIFMLFRSNDRTGLFVPNIAAFAILTIFISSQIYINHKKVSAADQYIFEDYALSAIGLAAHNSIIFSYQWDYLISGSYYLQFAEGFRKDVAVIDKELLRRSWYFDQLKTNYPLIVRRLKPEIDLFVSAVRPFERGEEYNPALLETLYRNMMTQLAAKFAPDHTVYIAPELVDNEIASGEFVLPAGYSLVPDLFFYRLVSTDGYAGAPMPKFKIRMPAVKNRYSEYIVNSLVCPMLLRRAMYERKFGYPEKARIYLDKIRQDFPDYQLPPETER